MADPTSYLQEEYRKAQRNFRVGLIVMGLLTVFMIGYFQWAKSKVAELLEPTAVSEFIVNETRRNLPDATAALKDTIREAAPEVVRFVMQQVVDVVFPLLRDSFKTSFNEYSQAMIVVGRDTTMVAFQDSVRTFKASRRRGDASADELATEASAYMRANLGKTLDTASAEVLGDKLAQSAQTLSSIDKRLKELAKPSRNREDELGKRLVTTWWSFLQQNRPELPEGALALPGGDLLDQTEVVAPSETGAKGKKRAAAK